MDFAIKQGDLLPAFAATLVDTDANPIDLTGVTAAVLRYRLYDRLTPLIERTIAIVTPVTAG